MEAWGGGGGGSLYDIARFPECPAQFVNLAGAKSLLLVIRICKPFS